MRVVVVGNGMAGHRFAQELGRRERELQADIEVVVIGSEPMAAYNRVLLSSVLAGTTAPEAVELAAPMADVRLGRTVVGVDTDGRRVTLDDGEDLHYDELVMATGSRAVLPPVEGLANPAGEPADGVTTFRTLQDCTRIASLATAGPMVVLGGGLLGIEAARGLAGRGVEVTLVHAANHLMERQLDPGGGGVLARVLSGMGVRVLRGVAATSWQPGALTLADGTVLHCAGLVVTAGVEPQTWLARGAGVKVERGIVVDDRMATSVPHVHAIGECAQHRGSCAGLVAPCWEQATVLADVLSGARPEARYLGSSPITRLKARDIDLASMGRHGDPDDPETEIVSLSDPAHGRYGSLTLRGGRVQGAVLLGLSEATGPVTQLFDSRAPVPSDRMNLLLGRAPGHVTDSPAQLPARAVVCRCNGVTKGSLVAAWRSGARDMNALATATRATTGCGSCKDTVDGLCSWLAVADPDPVREDNAVDATEGAA